MLVRHERFEGCPTFVFIASRVKVFVLWSIAFGEYVPLEQVMVLLEHTGSYRRLVERYLLELDITVYRIHVQKRAKGCSKPINGMP